MIFIIYPYPYTFRVVHHYAEMAAKVRKKRGKAKVSRQPVSRKSEICSAEGDDFVITPQSQVFASSDLRANL